MGYRQVYIRKARKLAVKHQSLLIVNDEQVLEIPLEDIASILLEDQQTVITSRLLSALSENYITMIICNERYQPSSISMPMYMHYRQLKVFYQQMEVKKPLLSQIWASIVRAKIINQITILELNKCSDEKIQKMKIEVKQIQSGDKTNREAVCAKLFFNTLYGSFFVRDHNGDDGINMALNYGYTIMAAQITRVLTMYGFHTMLGIHHCSQQNNFNLSYDFVEPFRAIVDKYVYDHKDELDSSLAIQTRKDLIALLQESVLINDKRHSVQNAIEEMVLSYIKCLDNDDSSFFVIPTLLYEPGNNLQL